MTDFKYAEPFRSADATVAPSYAQSLAGITEHLASIAESLRTLAAKQAAPQRLPRPVGYVFDEDGVW